MHSIRRVPHTLLVVPALLILAGARPAGAVSWLKSVDNREPWELALDLANRNREPIMAFVYVEDLQLTQMMDNVTFADKDVSEAAKQFLCVRVDIFPPENGPFLDRYGVRRFKTQPDETVKLSGAHVYPVTIFISPSGDAEHMVYGFLPPDAFLKIVGQARQVIELREKLNDTPDDARALASLGGLYVELQRYEVGREVLEKALTLDPDNALGIGETALLDLAVATMAEEDFPSALDLLTNHIATFPDSELRCKAHYLLGGAMLAAAETVQLEAQELEAAGDAAGAAAARESAQLARRQALEAWQWFETGEERDGPCAETEWSAVVLGVMEALRVEVAFHAAANTGQAGDPQGGLNALREFVKEHREQRDTEPVAGRIYNAEFLIGKYLMATDQFGDATDHWRSFIGRYPPEAIPRRLAAPEFEDTCEAVFLLGECLLKLGNREQALKQWQALAAADETNPCRSTVWPAEARTALEKPDNQ